MRTSKMCKKCGRELPLDVGNLQDDPEILRNAIKYLEG